QTGDRPPQWWYISACWAPPSMATPSTARSRRFSSVDRTMWVATADGFRRRRWINTPRRSLLGLASPPRTCRAFSRIWPISRRPISVSWGKRVTGESRLFQSVGGAAKPRPLHFLRRGNSGWRESLLLPGGESEKDAIVHGNRVRKDGGGARPRKRHVAGVAADRGACGLRITRRRVTGLQRDPCRLWCAISRSQARVADEDLPVAAVRRSAGCLGLCG